MFYIIKTEFLYYPDLCTQLDWFREKLDKTLNFENIWTCSCCFYCCCFCCCCCWNGIPICYAATATTAPNKGLAWWQKETLVREIFIFWGVPSIAIALISCETLHQTFGFWVGYKSIKKIITFHFAFIIVLKTITVSFKIFFQANAICTWPATI